jgi:hypothetical protein
VKKFIYILLCIPFLVACKKDDDSIPADHRRIKQIKLSNNAGVVSTKILYSYNNNLLMNRTFIVKSGSSYNTWDTTTKCNYTYSGDIVTAVLYLGDEGELHLGEKMEYEFTDKRMVRMKYFEYVDDQFMSRNEYFFNFNGELLESFNVYTDFEGYGILHEVSLGEYTYEDQNVIRFRIKDLYTDEYFYNEDFVYENDVLDHWSSSENYRLTNYWNNLDKESYEYNSENILEKTRIYEWHNYWSYNYSISFQYDQSNLVIEDYGVGALRNEYIYEDGIGNSEQLVFNPMDRVYNRPIIENIYDGSLKARYKLGNKHNSN